MIKEKHGFRTFLFVVMIVCVFAFPDTIKGHVASSLKRCALQVIPSIFPMLVISRTLYPEISQIPSFAKRIISPIFSIPTALCDIALCGILCGFPVAAIIAAEKYKNQEISRDEFAFFLPYFNNASPSFTIFFTGGCILSSYTLGAVIYILNLAAVITLLKIQKTSVKREYTNNIYISSDLTSVIRSSSHTMIEICGFVVFFSAVCSVVLVVASAVGIPMYVTSLFCGIIEITCGQQMLNNANLFVKFILCTIINSFGGLSSFFQVRSVADECGISSARYLLSKMMISAISTVYALIFIIFYQKLFT